MWRYNKEWCRIRFYLRIEPRKSDSFKTSVWVVEVKSKQYLYSENILIKFCIGILLLKHFTPDIFASSGRGGSWFSQCAQKLGFVSTSYWHCMKEVAWTTGFFSSVSCEKTVSICEQKKNKTASKNGINYYKCEHNSYSFSLDIATCSEDVQCQNNLTAGSFYIVFHFCIHSFIPSERTYSHSTVLFLAALSFSWTLGCVGGWMDGQVLYASLQLASVGFR